MSSIYLGSLYDVVANTSGGSGIGAVAGSTLGTLSTAQANVNTTGASIVKLANANLKTRLSDAATISTRATSLASVAGALQTFSSVLTSLKDSTETAGITGFSDNAGLRVAVGKNAATGTTKLSVDQLAQAQVNVSADAADATNAANFGNGSITIQEGNKNSVQLYFTNAMSLTDIARAINDAGANVTAEVVQNGSAFRLQVTGKDTGADNDVTYTEMGTSFGLADRQTQGAQDLTGSVNGSAFRSATNVINQVVPSASLVASATFTDATVTLSADPTAAAAGVQAFVRAYNTALTAVNTAQASAGYADVLDGLRGQLARFAGGTTTAAQGTYNALAQVGVYTQNDGFLGVDTSKLNQAANTDPLGVASVLSGNRLGQNGIAADLQKAVLDYARPASGILAQNGYGLQTLARHNGLAILRDAETVEGATERVTSDIAAYQRRLAELTVDALLVPLLPTS